MMRISFGPMKFGSENELNIALTELRWIKNIRGKLRNSDFKTVSEKYRFPIDFLKKGIKGFSYPEDFLISKSKWFPIFYSWVVRERQLSINLLKLQIDYVRTKFRFTLFLCIFGGSSLYASSILQSLFQLDLLQILSLVVIPYILSLIALYAELRNNLASRKMKMDDYTAQLEEMGLRRIITSNEQFIRQYYKYAVYAGGIILEKVQSSPTLTFFYMGTTEKEREKQRTRFNRLLEKLHLLPKPSAPIEREKIPVFYAENPFIEYRKRIEELAKI